MEKIKTEANKQMFTGNQNSQMMYMHTRAYTCGSFT